MELDPAIIEIARRYFREEWVAAESDARVRVHVTDGRRFVQTAEGPFDAIVVNPWNEQTGSIQQRRYWKMFTEGAHEDVPEAVDRLKYANKLLGITPKRGRTSSRNFHWI